MTSFGRLGPMIIDNRCCAYGKAIRVFARNKCQDEKTGSPGKTRPMVTAAELEMSDSNPNAEKNDDDELEVPTTCCMSGCANCVWIQYAESLSEKLQKSDEDVQKIIMEKIEDPNMRAFLSMELRCRNLMKT